MNCSTNLVDLLNNLVGAICLLVLTTFIIYSKLKIKEMSK